MGSDNLRDLLKESARLYPKRIALVFGQKRITYQDLDRFTDFFAVRLIHRGIEKLNRVALFLDNCPELIISYFAILKAGAVVIPINYMFKIEETGFILEDSQAVCLITSRSYLNMAEELRSKVKSLKQIISTASIRPDNFDTKSPEQENLKTLNQRLIAADELAAIVYTSGTTGHPKGAMLTHRNLISNAQDCSAAIRLTRKDAVICFLPLFHSFAAMVCMILPLYIGAKIVLMKSVRPFKRIIRSIRKNKITIFVGIPSVYNILKDIKFPGILNTPLIRLFNPVKVCISGAAALPVATLNAFEKKFRIPLLEGYGLTEASPVVTLNPAKGVRKPGSIGVALSPRIELKVIDEKGESLGPEQVGELIVRGPNVMQGYYRQEEATRETLKSGWLYTGDMVRFDQEGYFYVVGRKKEMINVRGLNVYPREIEEALSRHPKVKDSAVVGMPDIHKGEVPKGFIVLKDGEAATTQEILQYLRSHLAAYKIPKHLEFRESLPRSASGKILKQLLKEEK